MSTTKVVRELKSNGSSAQLSDSEHETTRNSGQGQLLTSLRLASASVDSSESRSDLFLNFRNNRKLNLDPFLCDIVRRSVQFDDAAGGLRFADLSVQGTLGFIDISGYSKTSAYLAANGGAHALADAVNSYLEPIIDVVMQHQGDIIKFAGDAVVAMWHAGNPTENCRLAVKCAQALLALPEKPITEGLSLALHIGISCGTFQSAVLCPRSHVKASVMQQAFHYLAGQPLNDISDVVDGAKRGEFRVSKEVAETLRSSFEFQTTDDSRTFAFVSALPAPPSTPSAVSETGTPAGGTKPLRASLNPEEKGTVEEWDALEAMAALAEVPDFEERFVPPAVCSRLKAGLRLLQMAEMRHLFILFIKMADESEDSREWFEEVHAVLEANGCPITQLIHDDKGFHVIGAVNLYVGDSEGPRTTIRIVQQLQERGVKCITGIAGGVCFCGVVGSDAKCRWDITGDPCIRACRLMQFAESNSMSCIFDLSVHDQLVEKSFLTAYQMDVVIKGTPDPLPVVFTLSTEESSAALSSICGINDFSAQCRLKERLMVQKHLGIDGQLKAAATPPPSAFLMIIGPPLSGKKTVFLGAVAQTSFVPVMYRARHNAEKVELCSCIGHWFSLHQDPKISGMGMEMLSHCKGSRNSAAVRILIEIVLYMVTQGTDTVMVIANIQHLDSATLRMMKQVTTRVRQLHSETSGLQNQARRLGSWHWCGTLTAVYGAQSSASIRESFPADFEYTLEPLSESEVQSQILAHGRTVMSGAALTTFTAICGGSPGLLTAISKWAAPVTSEDMLTPADPDADTPTMKYVCLGTAGTMHWSDRGLELLTKYSRRSVLEEHIPKMLSLCDVLPARLQFVLKIAATLCIENLPVSSCCIERVAAVSLGCSEEAIRDDLRILSQLLILQTKRVNASYSMCSFVLPPLPDILTATITPKQRKVVCSKGAASFCDQMDEVALNNPWIHLHRARVYSIADEKTNLVNSLHHAWSLHLLTKPDPGREMPECVFWDFEYCLSYEMVHSLRLVSNQADLNAFFGRRVEEEGQTKSVSTAPSAATTSTSAAAAPLSVMPRLFAHRPFDKVFRKTVLEVGIIEPPLSLGPIAGKVRFLVFRFLEKLFLAQKAVRPVEAVPDLTPSSYMKLMDRFNAVVSVPPDDWNEERMRITITRSEEAQLVEEALEHDVPDVETGLERCPKLVKYFEGVILQRSRQVTVWAKYLTGFKLSSSADGEALPASLECAAHKALTAALQLMLDNHHVRELDKEREPILHRVLMLLAAANWSTTTPYMTPAALRDCILLQWIDWDEVKAILFLHILESLPEGITVQVTSATRVRIV